MKFRFVVLLVILFVPISILGQSPAAYQRAGDKAMSVGDYYSATSYYYSAYVANATDAEITGKLAEACRRYNDYDNAEKYYNKVFGLDKEAKFPLTLFYLAEMKQRQGEYQDAAQLYTNYLQRYGSDSSWYAKKAVRELYNCNQSPVWLKDTAKVSIENMGSDVNSVYSDFAPQFVDTTTILYSSLRFENKNADTKKKNKYISKLLISKSEFKSWSKSTEYSNVLNAMGVHSCNAALSSNGKFMIYTQCNSQQADLNCKLYISFFNNNEWSAPQLLNDTINLKGYTATMPAIANRGIEGYTVYFVSNRPGGLGKLDIWKSDFSADYVFSAPVNAGPIINTPDDDITPFYDNMNQVLYFSSEGHAGFGGYDIYKYVTNDKGIGEVINAGFPINTSYNDLYYVADKKNFLLSSNRPGSLYIKARTCCYDIYQGVYKDTLARIKPDTLITLQTKPVVNPADSATMEISRQMEPLLPLKLYFDNDQPNPKTMMTTTRLNYVDLYNNYIASERNYMDNYTAGNADEQKRKLAAEEISRFFAGTVKKSFLDLDRFSSLLLKQLQGGNKVEIIVRGSASPLANSQYNKNLSKRRIASLKNFWQFYQDGKLASYLKTGKLIISEDPVGEDLSSGKVSDDVKDKRNSVYSPSAAALRYIQVMRVFINGEVVE